MQSPSLAEPTDEFLYVEDVAKVIELCLLNKHASRQILNVRVKDTLTVESLVSKLVPNLRTYQSTKIHVKRKPMRKGETLNFEPDLNKLQHETWLCSKHEPQG